MTPIRIVLVEDNHLQRLAMENILTAEPDLILVKSRRFGDRGLSHVEWTKQ
jgi:chemotaxis response regulator CheB